MIPSAIEQAFGRPYELSDYRLLAGGLSGARVYHACGPGSSSQGSRIQQTDGYVLRCWPSQVTQRRVDHIHQVIGSAAEHCAFLLKPLPVGAACSDHRSVFGHQLTSMRDDNGRIWELNRCLPGRPLAVDADVEQICQGVSALADVHQSLRRQGNSQAVAESITERTRRIAQLTTQLPSIWGLPLQGRISPRVVDQLVRVQTLLRAKWGGFAGEMSIQLGKLAARRLPVHFVLRDTRRQHALFDQGKVSGIIDYDALRVDFPAVDLARWVSGFALYQSQRQEILKAVVAEYNEKTTFPSVYPVEELTRAIELIAESSQMISLANWLVWLAAERRQFEDWSAVSARLNELLSLVD